MFDFRDTDIPGSGTGGGGGGATPGWGHGGGSGAGGGSGGGPGWGSGGWGGWYDWLDWGHGAMTLPFAVDTVAASAVFRGGEDNLACECECTIVSVVSADAPCLALAAIFMDADDCRAAGCSAICSARAESRQRGLLTTHYKDGLPDGREFTLEPSGAAARAVPFLGLRGSTVLQTAAEARARASATDRPEAPYTEDAGGRRTYGERQPGTADAAANIFRSCAHVKARRITAATLAAAVASGTETADESQQAEVTDSSIE